jgi:hypothetical protein
MAAVGGSTRGAGAVGGAAADAGAGGGPATTTADAAAAGTAPGPATSDGSSRGLWTDSVPLTPVVAVGGGTGAGTASTARGAAGVGTAARTGGPCGPGNSIARRCSLTRSGAACRAGALRVAAGRGCSLTRARVRVSVPRASPLRIPAPGVAVAGAVVVVAGRGAFATGWTGGVMGGGAGWADATTSVGTGVSSAAPLLSKFSVHTLTIATVASAARANRVRGVLMRGMRYVWRAGYERGVRRRMRTVGDTTGTTGSGGTVRIGTSSVANSASGSSAAVNLAFDPRSSPSSRNESSDSRRGFSTITCQTNTRGRLTE